MPPLLEARMMFDGYQIVREIHGSSRSHIYLAVDSADGAMVALKIPSIDLRGDPAYLQAIHDGGMGGAAHQQRPCSEAVHAIATAELSLCRRRNSSMGRR